MICYRNIGGQWLLESTTAIEPGTEVTVTKRDGSTKRERVGQLVGSNGYGFRYQIERASRAPSQTMASPTARVGDLSGILQLFERARAHLKFPAIVLGVAGHGLIRINVAGPRARAPGSLTVVDGERPDHESGERREWFGRVHLDGSFECSRALAGTEHGRAIEAKLRAFAADPARVAGEHGRLTGRCCFCNRPLSDERSTAVGYGQICAAHYGLDWGTDRTDFKADSPTFPFERKSSEAGSSDWTDERAMMAMEAAADRAGTIREEANKLYARGEIGAHERAHHHEQASLIELAARFRN